MNYQKKGTQVLIGNATIPNYSRKDYIGTLCFSTQTKTGTNEFVDIACSREQLEGLVVKLSRYLELCKEREAS